MVARRRVYPYAHTSHDKRITVTVNGHHDANPDRWYNLKCDDPGFSILVRLLSDG